jgi:hypothetical protein
MHKPQQNGMIVSEADKRDSEEFCQNAKSVSMEIWDRM